LLIESRLWLLTGSDYYLSYFDLLTNTMNGSEYKLSFFLDALIAYAVDPVNSDYLAIGSRYAHIITDTTRVC